MNDLLVSSRAVRVRDTKDTVRICRGVHLPVDSIPDDAPDWQIRRIVAEARALAITLTLGGDNPPVLTCESALMLYGIDTWWNVPDIIYRRRNHPINRIKLAFPQVTVHGVVVPEARLVELTEPSISTACASVAGVLVEPLGMVAIDCARWLHPLPAVVAVSGILRRMSQFDRRIMEQSREAEQKARRSVLERHEMRSGKHGYQRERAVLEAADAGIESPGEGAVLWALHCITHGAGGVDIVTQQPVRTSDRCFYGDLALPEYRAIVEFDGYSKVSGKGQERAFINRQRQILSAGWKMIRVELSELREVVSFIWRLIGELREAGVPVTAPSGPLWKPLNSEFTGTERRF